MEDDDDGNGQPQDSSNKQPSSKNEAGSSKEKVPLQDQTLKENCPTDVKKRSNTQKGSKEMNENTLALPKKRKRKLQQNGSCPEIVSNDGDKTKKKKENQNEKKILRDAQIAAANKVAVEIFQQQEAQSLADTKEQVTVLKAEVSQLKQLVKMKDEVIMQLKEKEQEQRMLHSNYDTTNSDLLSSLEAKKSLIHDLEEKNNKLASDNDSIKRELQEIQRKQAVSSQKGMKITMFFVYAHIIQCSPTTTSHVYIHAWLHTKIKLPCHIPHPCTCLTLSHVG